MLCEEERTMRRKEAAVDAKLRSVKIEEVKVQHTCVTIYTREE